MKFTHSLVFLIVALVVGTTNGQFTNFNVKSSIEANPCFTSPVNINADTCSAGRCNSNFKIVTDTKVINQFSLSSFTEKECKTTDGSAAITFMCVDSTTQIPVGTSNSITCVGTTGKFTSFKVKSTADANTCNKAPIDIKYETCVAGCGTNMKVTADSSLNNFKYSEFSDSQCNTAVGAAFPFTCVDNKSQISVGTNLITCIGSLATPEPVTNGPTEKPTETPTPEHNSASIIVSSLSLVFAAVVSAFL